MAGPALWALRQCSGLEFEVSVLPVEGATPWRKGLEALAISLYRQENGRSPNVNFGRMPIGYRPSSHNNGKLATAGRLYRGEQQQKLTPAIVWASHPKGGLTVIHREKTGEAMIGRIGNRRVKRC